MTLLFRVIAAAAAFSFIAGVGQAQDKAADKVKIGLITTLSGPPAVIGQQQRNGFQLALKELGNKLGGRDVELLVQDDELKPDLAVSKVKALSSATRSTSWSARCSPISWRRSSSRSPRAVPS